MKLTIVNGTENVYIGKEREREREREREEKLSKI